MRPRTDILFEAVANHSESHTTSMKLSNECCDLVVRAGVGGGLFPHALLADSVNQRRVHPSR